MAQAVINPDETEDFTNHLQRFMDDLNDMVNDLNTHFRTLGETWADPKYLEFEEVLKDLEAFLKRFDAEATEQVRWLRRKIQEAREYLGR
ncbi:hypothetical protein [Helicobacter bizzozeronii]|uniref:WXG100 family type VII secretion target n=1 Tax=Helicobacter bizzozeronii (strain CIII-1) TaxID=1002804 RepID=F8KTL5_HELBC|nr:hypothetical protein [Helicobacter bizzozeronii]CCB80185.1 conserved hypothetical protein [Helicobacter bizzozeronii CIII-1]CCF79873.1 conserved hypothetical protein [Helicobacter bizzozeronii CCUG 35545]